MPNMLANIFNVFQHLSTLKHSPDNYCPHNCPNCSKNGLWKHGVYYRQAQCENQEKAVSIPRFFCPHCKCTCSTLPEYIPPRRWYYWITQQALLLGLLLGKGAEKACEALADKCPVVPSINTAYRWLRWLKESFLIHQSCLCHLHPPLRFEQDNKSFWLSYFEQEGGLSSAMLSLNRASLAVP